MRLDRIFGVYNEGDHKIINILGMKLKLNINAGKTSKLIEKQLHLLHRDLNRTIQKNLTVCVQHQNTFLRYKNINNSRDVVLVATGPTLNYFPASNSSSSFVYVGCNAAFKCNKMKLDYLFIQDYEACKDYIEDVPKYVDRQCELFYGFTLEYRKDRNKVIPESIAINANAHRYYTDWAPIKYFKSEFVYDISTQPLCCWGTIAFPTMQFILWTNPKRVYLVGCDCSSSHYDKTPLADNLSDLSHLINKWKVLRDFAYRYYPDTEIISVNPVGLRGIFKEVWTEEYLAEHPEIRQELGDNIEILN